MVRLAQIERSAVVRRAAPVVAGTLLTHSNVRVRNVATVGGNLAHGDPHMDLPPVLIALGALLIAQCADAADIAACVHFARDHALPLAARGSGHACAGTALCDDGLVVDLSRMKEIRVVPDQGVARAQPGVTWGDMDHATQAFGFAVPGGTDSEVGIAGLSLGGGNFGIATPLEYRMHPIGPSVVAGTVFYPLEQPRGVLARFGDFAATGPA